MNDATKPDPDDRPAGGSTDTPLPAADGDAVATIMRDIACPGCEYNLRGLHGPVVECPECGRRCDIVELITAKWDKPWHKAPGFNTVLLPTAWAMLGWIGMGVLLVIPDPSPWLPVASWLVFLGVWALLMWRAWVLFGSAVGVGLALLSHAILFGYLAGFIIAAFTLGTLGVGIVRLLADDEPMGILATIARVFFAALSLIAIYLSRRGEKFIAACCIKRHLAKLGADPAAS